MFRPFTLLGIAWILPALVGAQEPSTHTVVPGNTLWGIARERYGDPYQWTRIWEANREAIDNPHRILPGQVLLLPGGTAPVSALEVRVEPGPAGAVPGTVGVTVQSAGEPDTRTVFYRERPVEVVAFGPDRALWDVPPEQFYSAPWLIPPGTVPERTGAVTGLAAGDDLPGSRTAAQPFDRVRLALEGPAPQAGARLQVFRVARSIHDVGDVVQPTGIVVVEQAGPAGVVARVESQFERVLAGDLVRPLPPFEPLPVDALVPVAAGAEAVVLGYASERALQGIGNFAFLDAGANEGVTIGDEYVVVSGEVAPGAGRVVGRVKVVSVLRNVATARIVHLENPVFVPGVRLRPDRRVR